VGLVVDNVALGQDFSDYFGFPCQSSFHQLLHNHHHLSSGAGRSTKRLSLTPLIIIIIIIIIIINICCILSNFLSEFTAASCSANNKEL
jgi:hypothetical protein